MPSACVKMHFSYVTTNRFGNWSSTYLLLNIAHLCYQGRVEYSLMPIFIDPSLLLNEKSFRTLENLATDFFCGLSYLRQKHRKTYKLKLPSSDRYLNSLILDCAMFHLKLRIII